MRRFGDGLKSLQPLTDGDTKRHDGNASKVLRISLQSAQSRSQQRNGPGVVAALKVMKGGCHLNERLQELLFRLACREPNRFPVLVCFEVRAGIKAVQTLP